MRLLLGLDDDFRIAQVPPELQHLTGRTVDDALRALQPRGDYSVVLQPANADGAAAIRNALEQHRWNREAAARALGVSRTTLWRKMRELGLN